VTALKGAGDRKVPKSACGYKVTIMTENLSTLLYVVVYSNFVDCKSVILIFASHSNSLRVWAVRSDH